MLTRTKIEKPIIVDVEDKATTKAKQYTKENLVEYEMATRDSRIGEITNISTSILNQYTTNPLYAKINADNVSLLRIYQGEFLAPSCCKVRRSSSEPSETGVRGDFRVLTGNSFAA